MLALPPLGAVLMGDDPIKAALRRDAVALWGFENSANLGLDSTPNGNHLTNNNSVSPVPGQIGQAAQLVGASSQSFSLANPPTLAFTGSFTLCTWLQWVSLPGVARGIVTKWSATIATEEYALYYNVTANRLSFFTSDGTAQHEAVANSLGLPTVGPWYCIVAGYDAAAQVNHIQVNGGAIDTVASTGGMHADTNTFRIGRDQTTSTISALIDQTALWPRVLTAQEHAWLAAGNALA